MPVDNVTIYYDILITNASIITAVDDSLTAIFFDQPWHWTIGAFVTMALIYMKTEDLFVTSLPGMTLVMVLIIYGKVTTSALLPLSLIGIFSFAAFFYTILKDRGR